MRSLFVSVLLVSTLISGAQAAGKKKHSPDSGDSGSIATPTATAGPLSLSEAIEGQLTAGISARMGNKSGGGGTRYFLAMFSFEDAQKSPEASHTFATFIRVSPSGTRYSTISWLPANIMNEPLLCVFKGPLSLFISKANRCEPLPGRNYSLEQTLELASAFQRRVGLWGPYEIHEELYDRALQRIAFLETGAVDYLADDRVTRKKGTAINCLHAVSDLDQDKISMGGFLNTGLHAWGFDGTRHVLDHYREKGSSWLAEPVNPKGDLHDFVFGQ